MEVYLRGLDIRVAEPERDARGVDPGVQQAHRAGALTSLSSECMLGFRLACTSNTPTLCAMAMSFMRLSPIYTVVVLSPTGTTVPYSSRTYPTPYSA